MEPRYENSRQYWEAEAQRCDDECWDDEYDEDFQAEEDPAPRPDNPLPPEVG